MPDQFDNTPFAQLGNQLEEWHKLSQEGNDAYEQRRYTEAEFKFVGALKIAEKASLPTALGTVDSEVQSEIQARLAKSLNNMADLYHTQGKYNMAEDLYKRCLELKTRLYGEEHPEIAINLLNLAVLYSAKRRYAEAELFYQRALELRERLLGVDHPELVSLLKHYALLLKRTDRDEQAVRLEDRASEIERLAEQKNPSK